MIRACLVFATTAALLAGCSGDDDDNGSSGVSSDKQLNEISQGELVQLCNATKPRFDSILRGGCALDGFAVSESEAECETFVDECMSEGGIDCTGATTADITDCTITVGALESCLNQLGTYFDAITCTEGPTEDVPACFGDVQAQCPIFAAE